MVFSTEHQLELPDNFPADEMVAFMASARHVLLTPGKSEAWKEFGGASNLIGWRFRACHDDMLLYIKCWELHGANVSFEQIYQRERALFGMFTAGVSCIESACYALNALASHPKLLGLQFGEHEQRSCNPARLKERLSTNPKTHTLSNALEQLTNSKEWALWVELRNRMTHRSNLPRIINGAAGSAPPPEKALQFAATSSTAAFEADATHLENIFTWLANSLQNLLVEGKEFADQHS